VSQLSQLSQSQTGEKREKWESTGRKGGGEKGNVCIIVCIGVCVFLGKLYKTIGYRLYLVAIVPIEHTAIADNSRKPAF
jgi:hypothetical protein